MASGTERPRRHTPRDRARLRHAPLAPDAAAGMVLGMAATAMPFAPSVEGEAERWLRILRLYGEAGSALQGLGVSEAPLEALDNHDEGARTDEARVHSRSVVAAVTERAGGAARRRGADTIGTCDVFVAVLQVYGADFERVLWAHGTDSDEVLERLGVTMPPGDPPG